MQNKNNALRTTLVAVLDLDAPANTVRYDRLREPDVFDPEEGIYAWTNDDHTLVVTVPMDRFDDFRAYVKARGLCPLGSGLARFFEFGAPAGATWERIAALCIAQPA